jgi:hypothetical protein
VPHYRQQVLPELRRHLGRSGLHEPSDCSGPTGGSRKGLEPVPTNFAGGAIGLLSPKALGTEMTMPHSLTARAHGTTGAMIAFGAACVAVTLLAAFLTMPLLLF